MLLRKVNFNHLYSIPFTSHHSLFESSIFIFLSREPNLYKDVFEYVQKSVSLEELQFLLTEDKPWEKFVIEADLSR